MNAIILGRLNMRELRLEKMSFLYSVSGGRFLVLLAILAPTLAACGKQSENQASAPNGQIVARVNNQVITTQELETEFRWANVPNDRRRDPDIVKRILGELVTRKYLLQQAEEAKLDREPTVLLDLLRAREQVLANAFSSRKIASRSSSVTKADIDKFIAKNPAKFADQQRMNVDQITVSFDLKTQSAIEAAKSLSSLDEVDQKLTSLGIPHSRSLGVLNSAEIPDDLLKSIQARRPDSVFFARAGQNGVFLKIKNIEPHPVDGDAAVTLARQLLRIEMLKAEASMAGIAANIEAKFEGEYVRMMMADPSGNPTNN